MLAHAASPNDYIDPLSVWAEREDRARFVVGDDGRVVWSNDAAGRFVAEAGPFRLIRDRLVPRDPRLSQAFQLFIASSGPAPSTLCVPGDADRHVLCIALGLGPGLGRRMTGLTLRCATGDVPLHAAALQAAYRLTVSERRIVELMFSGRTAEEVSCELRVAIATVRVHIRHIYEKLNVASREAMFHTLAPFLSVD